MKKKTKKIIFVILLIVLIIKYLSSIHFMYKINWGISVPEPKRVEHIYKYRGFQFGQYLDIMHYSKRKINKLIKKSYFKKIEGENKEYIINKYNEYLNRWDEKMKALFNDTIQPDYRFNENNYYALFEENCGEPNYRILILVIDTNNNSLYSIDDNS